MDGILAAAKVIMSVLCSSDLISEMKVTVVYRLGVNPGAKFVIEDNTLFIGFDANPSRAEEEAYGWLDRVYESRIDHLHRSQLPDRTKEDQS